MNQTACLFNAARRLRYLRSFPHFSTASGVMSDAQREAAATAVDWALRIVLDEFGQTSTPEWSALYHGPAGEHHENQPEISA